MNQRDALELDHTTPSRSETFHAFGDTWGDVMEPTVREGKIRLLFAGTSADEYMGEKLAHGNDCGSQ